MSENAPTAVLEAEAALEQEIAAILQQGQLTSEQPHMPVVDQQQAPVHQVSTESIPTNPATFNGESADSILGTPVQVDQPESTQTDANGSASSYEELEQKYKSLQGQFKDPDMVKAVEENTALKGQVNELSGKIDALMQMQQQQTAPVQPKQVPIAPTNMKVGDIYSHEEVEEYGQEQLDANLKPVNQFREEMDLKMQAMQAEFDKKIQLTQQQSEEAQHQANINAFWSEIESHIPQGRMINASNSFQEWASEIPAGSGGNTRLAMMSLAADRGDAIGVASIILDFTKSQENAQTKTQEHVNTQIEPNTAAGGITTTDNPAFQGKRIFSKAEAAEIVENCQAFAYGEKSETVLNEMMAAYNENRVR